MGNYKHGLYKHPLYQIWLEMRRRCHNPKSPRYQNYGGRGIKVCEEWKEAPVRFIQWALNNRWEKGLYLDRQDNDQGYFPDNCRFIDKGLSNRNTQLLNKDNSTGYRGVSFDTGKQKFVSYIKIHGKSKHLGYYSSPVSAAKAYDSMAIFLNDGRPTNFGRFSNVDICGEAVGE